MKSVEEPRFSLKPTGRSEPTTWLIQCLDSLIGRLQVTVLITTYSSYPFHQGANYNHSVLSVDFCPRCAFDCTTTTVFCGPSLNGVASVARVEFGVINV